MPLRRSGVGTVAHTPLDAGCRARLRFISDWQNMLWVFRALIVLALGLVLQVVAYTAVYKSTHKERDWAAAKLRSRVLEGVTHGDPSWNGPRRD